MDNYISKYNKFSKKIVYNFNLGSGGIGDYIKFFLYTLELCIKYECKLYYKINNIRLEKYIFLKNKEMVISYKDNSLHNINKLSDDNIDNMEKIETIIKNLHNNKYYIVEPYMFYNIFDYKFITINANDIFDFSNDVKLNTYSLLPFNINNYISMHLRMGDKYLVLNKRNNIYETDERNFSEENIHNFILNNLDKHIIFFCDDNDYKQKLQRKYNNIILTNSIIGHTDLINTSEKEILDAVTEFYLLTKSNKICCCSSSGFSIMASKFNNIPLINIY